MSMIFSLQVSTVARVGQNTAFQPTLTAFATRWGVSGKIEFSQTGPVDGCMIERALIIIEHLNQGRALDDLAEINRSLQMPLRAILRHEDGEAMRIMVARNGQPFISDIVALLEDIAADEGANGETPGKSETDPTGTAPTMHPNAAPEAGDEHGATRL